MKKDPKIYTKTGDRGETSLIGGTRVPKFHPRIEAYGTVDELNSTIGLIRDSTEDEHLNHVLLRIQQCLFVVESSLAKDPDVDIPVTLPAIIEDDITKLEREIDLMNEPLPELRSFILPGGHPLISNCHIARTVCRRAERMAIRLSAAQTVDFNDIKYLNRLSDYLFILARKFHQDLGVDEIHWNPAR